MSKLVIGLAAVGLTAVFGSSAAYQLATHETERFTVVKAETIFKGQNEGKEKRINVILENGCPETFLVEDSLLNGQWYSANLHTVFAEGAAGDAEDRKTYEGTHYGWRSGFFSMMENVIEAEELQGVGPYKLRPDAATACKL